MKLIVTFLILLNISHAFKITKEIKIGKYYFTLVEESYREYGDKGTMLRLYSNTDSSKKNLLLKLVLENQVGNCSVSSAQLGAYEIKENTLTLYSRWVYYKGEDNVPVGDRIQIYEADEDGSIHKVFSQVYIEQKEKKGVKYLMYPPQTAQEKEYLESYIASTERIFKADFVMGNKAKVLATKVSQVLERKPKQRWR